MFHTLHPHTLTVKESWASGGRPRITEKSMSKEVLRRLVIPVIPILSDMLARAGVQVTTLLLYCFNKFHHSKQRTFQTKGKLGF